MATRPRGSSSSAARASRISRLVCHLDLERISRELVLTFAPPGDRVAVEPGVPCDKCFLCREGRYNLCEDVQFAGVYPYHGTAQRYKVHPAKWLHK